MNQKFIPIRAYDNYLNANMTLGMLQEAGISCHLKDEYTITIDPLLSPALGGMKLMVEAAQADEAMRLIQQAEEQFVQGKTCPACNQQRLIIVTETTRYSSIGGKIKSLLLNGQEEKIKKFYRCENCQSTFDELPI